jgi:hypothetical protein
MIAFGGIIFPFIVIVPLLRILADVGGYKTTRKVLGYLLFYPVSFFEIATYCYIYYTLKIHYEGIIQKYDKLLKRHEKEEIRKALRT